MIIESLIINALKNIGMPLDITPILSDRGGVEPAAPYLLINIISTTSIGLPTKSISHVNENISESIFQLKDFLVSLTFHASTKDGTHDWVQRLHTGIFTDLIDYSFTQQGLGIVDCKDIMYQPNPVDGKNYKRAILDITLRAEVEEKFTVNAMTGIGVEGSFTSEDVEGITGNVIVDEYFY